MVEHEETPGVSPTKDGVKQFFAGFRGAFPDLTMERTRWSPRAIS